MHILTAHTQARAPPQNLRRPPRPQVDYTITVQMLEIYNETLRDLLGDQGGAGGRLDILSTQASGCNVPGATQVGRGGGA
jgi:kinesin family protein C2/C3